MTTRGSITVQTGGANASLHADAQQCATWLTRAEGPVKLPATVANAIVFYRASMAKCLTCQSGQRCDAHGTQALRPPPAIDEPAGEDCRRITSVYFACFTEARGQAPIFGNPEGAAVKRLITAAGVDRAEQAIRGAYSDSYWRDKSTILTISADPSRHIGNAPSKKASLQADSGFQSTAKEVR
jgi:hypothetical protein